MLLNTEACSVPTTGPADAAPRGRALAAPARGRVSSQQVTDRRLGVERAGIATVVSRVTEWLTVLQSGGNRAGATPSTTSGGRSRRFASCFFLALRARVRDGTENRYLVQISMHSSDLRERVGASSCRDRALTAVLAFVGRRVVGKLLCYLLTVTGGRLV